MNYNLEEAILKSKLENDKLSIGERSEHSLHRVVKYLLEPTSFYHEQVINKKIVDICIDKHIYEIQTKAFHNLRSKLENIIYDYQMTIVYPLIVNKRIIKMDSDGQIISIRKSPKKVLPIHSLVEFYRIKNYLLEENLSFKIMIFEADEYQQTVQKSYKYKHGKYRIDQFPTKYIDEINLDNPNDYLKILPDLPTEFNFNDFIKNTKVNRKQGSYILAVLKYVGIVEHIRTEGRAYIYKIKSC